MATWHRSAARLAAGLLLAGLVAVAPVRAAAGDRGLEDGAWVSVEGHLDDEGRLHAVAVEPLAEPELSLRGPMTGVDAARRTVSFGPLVLPLTEGVEVESAAGSPIPLAELRPGRTVKATLERSDDGSLAVKRLRLRSGQRDDLRVRGQVAHLVTPSPLELSFEVLGLATETDELTAWKGLARPGGAPRTDAAGNVRLVLGARVEAKGRLSDADLLVAESITAADPDDDVSVKGIVESVDEAAGGLRVSGFDFELDAATEIEDEDRRHLALGKLRRGDRVKIYLEPGSGGGLRVRRVRLRDSTSDSVTLAGPVERLQPATSVAVRFVLLGREVVADAGTRWEGVLRPALLADDEDERPAEAIALGKLGYLSGEVRLDWKSEDNYDLTDRLAGDREDLRLRTDIEWTLPATKHVSGTLELKAERRWRILDEEDGRSADSRLRLGEAYLLLSGVLSRHGSVQVGRSRWDDRRDWWFREDLDSVRVYLDFPRWRLEAGYAEQLVDPIDDLEDASYTLLRGTVWPARDHEVSFVYMERDDWFVERDGEPRDFQPRWFGLHLEGEIREWWTYWLEVAVARGSFEGEKLRAHAADAGVFVTLPLRWEPTFAVGYAFGTGDEDDSDFDENFRQTGLHDNNGKWNGVTNFRYYGEVLRPELSNLHVQTYGLGLRPTPETSVDVIYHRYTLDEVTDRLKTIDAGDDRRMDLVHRDVGQELDVVIGFEELEHWEFELDVGIFRPGRAFLGDRDPAIAVFFKAKYVF